MTNDRKPVGSEIEIVAETIGYASQLSKPSSDAATQAYAPGDRSAAEPDRAGAVIAGEYVVLEEIARGGMGVVYRARHRTLGRIVALKQIRGGELIGTDELRRFQTEGQAAA